MVLGANSVPGGETVLVANSGPGGERFMSELSLAEWSRERILCG